MNARTRNGTRARRMRSYQAAVASICAAHFVCPPYRTNAVAIAVAESANCKLDGIIKTENARARIHTYRVDTRDRAADVQMRARGTAYIISATSSTSTFPISILTVRALCGILEECSRTIVAHRSVLVPVCPRTHTHTAVRPPGDLCDNVPHIPKTMLIKFTVSGRPLICTISYPSVSAVRARARSRKTNCLFAVRRIGRDFGEPAVCSRRRPTF